MSDKFLTLDYDTGRTKEKTTIITSTGAADTGKIPALDADGRLAQTFMPKGLVPDTQTFTAAENLAAGDFVTVDSGGNATKADSTAIGSEAIGFVMDAVLDTESALVYFEGTNPSIVATLTIGTRYFLGAGANEGTPVAAPPSADGNVIQYLGRATGANKLSFEPSEGIAIVVPA